MRTQTPSRPLPVRAAVAANFARSCLPVNIPTNGPEKITQFTHAQDGGHGWLIVPRGLVADVLGPFGGLGLVSGYSYTCRLPEWDGTVLWLEEDCDAPLFLALFAKQRHLFGAYRIAYSHFDDFDPRETLERLPKRTDAAGDKADALTAECFHR